MNLMHFLNSLYQSLGHGLANVGHGVANAEHGVAGVGNQINPFYAQPALAPESLGRKTPGANEYAPYQIHGKAAPAPSWFIRTPLQHPTIPMPQLLGMPDYTATNPHMNWQPMAMPDAPNPMPQGFSPQRGFYGPTNQIQNADPMRNLPRYQI